MAIIKHGHKAWLASEDYLAVTKTINSTVCATTETVVDADGNTRTICVSGGLYHSGNDYGILLEDVDVTAGSAIGAVVVAGHYIDANLPATLVSNVTNFAKTGLFPLTMGEVTRPDFGTDGLTKLVMGTVTASSKNLTWSKVNGAIGYDIYKGATLEGSIAQMASPTYTAKGTGSYTVKAIGDNISYATSDASTAVTVS